MPRQRLNVCSFFVYRPNENPRNHDYLPMLRLLQKSCDALDLRHVVLTDQATANELRPEGFETFAAILPVSLMQACTEIQALWLEQGDWQGADTITVGADCLILRNPDKHFPASSDADLCVTLRPGHDRYPINTGAILYRSIARGRLATIFRGIAESTGTRWCDDQRAIEQALSPMPDRHIFAERQGVQVAFLPMFVHNQSPTSVRDPARAACVLHFRGKNRKYMTEWAAIHRPEWLK